MHKKLFFLLLYFPLTSMIHYFFLWIMQVISDSATNPFSAKIKFSHLSQERNNEIFISKFIGLEFLEFLSSMKEERYVRIFRISLIS